MRFFVELIFNDAWRFLTQIGAKLVQIYNFFRHFVVGILFATYIRQDLLTGFLLLKLKCINHDNTSSFR